MKLTIRDFEQITVGAAYISEENGAVSLHRFTKEQEELYKENNADSYKKAFATAGIKMVFTTDSRHLSLKVEVSSGSSRKFFSHRLFVGDTLIGELSSTTENNGIFEKDFDLGEGEKTVCLYFPWSACSKVLCMVLDDGASVIPCRPSKKMLMFGDSITHGYDAVQTNRSYASLLADALDAEARNKAIGGQIFWRRLAWISDDWSPDYITVAYGTNDWSGRTREYFEENCAEFYRALSRKYPRAKIFAITPIWRADDDRVTKVGEFSYVSRYIRQVAADLPNVTVIEGVDLVPHDTSLFSDKYLHPNDEGFSHYFKNLFAELKQYI